MLKMVKVKIYEKGLLFREGELKQILSKGNYVFFDPFRKIKVNILSEKQSLIVHEDLDLIVKSGLINDYALIADLKDNQRGLLWIEGRFEKILEPGLYAFWNTVKNIKCDIIDANEVKFVNKDMDIILKTSGTDEFLNEFVVENGYKGLYFKNGEFVEVLEPGRYAFWKNSSKIKLYNKDIKVQTTEISGQDIMTNDKVTLRINAMVNFKIDDVFKSVTMTEDCIQALYKEAQLVLRSVIGTRDLDVLLNDKTVVSKELEDGLSKKVSQFGLNVDTFGIKDIILPGEMKDLLNKVIEAKKVSEANLISRREEVAAIRSQLNTAKMLEDNPTLMRLKELEVLEKISAKTNFNVMLSDKGLADKITKLI